MKKILIDSDVLMDFLTEREPFDQDSAKILTYCELKKVHGFVTPVIISNVYYLLKRVIKHDIAIEKIKRLMDFLDVLGINKPIIIHSLNSDFNDFEDALQNYAAQFSNKINIIITRNIKDYKHSELVVMTPSDFLKTT